MNIPFYECFGIRFSVTKDGLKVTVIPCFLPSVHLSIYPPMYVHSLGRKEEAG